MFKAYSEHFARIIGPASFVQCEVISFVRIIKARVPPNCFESVKPRLTQCEETEENRSDLLRVCEGFLQIEPKVLLTIMRVYFRLFAL